MLTHIIIEAERFHNMPYGNEDLESGMILVSILHPKGLNSSSPDIQGLDKIFIPVQGKQRIHHFVVCLDLDWTDPCSLLHIGPHKSLCDRQVIFTFSHKIACSGEALGKSLVLNEAMRMGSHNGTTALRKKESWTVIFGPSQHIMSHSMSWCTRRPSLEAGIEFF